MLLRNFYNEMMALSGVFNNWSRCGCDDKCNGATSIESSSFNDNNINCKSTNGSIRKTNLQRIDSTSSGYYVYTDCLLGLSKESICFGTGINGTDTVSINDYKLSGSSIDNKLTKLGSISYSYDTTTKNWIKNASFIYLNDSDTSVTIKEWGLWNEGGYSGGAFDNNSSDCILIYREVLNNPITISSNESVTLKFSIKFPTIEEFI